MYFLNPETLAITRYCAFLLPIHKPWAQTYLFFGLIDLVDRMR